MEGGLPSGWVSERTSAMFSIESSLRLSSAMVSRPAGERKSSSGWWTRAAAGLNSPTAKYRLTVLVPITLGVSASRSLNWL